MLIILFQSLVGLMYQLSLWKKFLQTQPTHNDEHKVRSMSRSAGAGQEMGDKFDLKVLHAGFHRSGTASVALALDILGLGPVWHGAMIPIPLLFKGIKWWTHNNCSIFNKASPPLNLNLHVPKKFFIKGVLITFLGICFSGLRHSFLKRLYRLYLLYNFHQKISAFSQSRLDKFI